MFRGGLNMRREGLIEKVIAIFLMIPVTIIFIIITITALSYAATIDTTQVDAFIEWLIGCAWR